MSIVVLISNVGFLVPVAAAAPDIAPPRNAATRRARAM